MLSPRKHFARLFHNCKQCSMPPTTEQQVAPPPGDPTFGVGPDDEATVIIPSSIKDPKKALQKVFEIDAGGYSMVLIEDLSFASSTEGSIVQIKANEGAKVVVESQSANHLPLPTPDLRPRRGSSLFGDGHTSIHSKESLTRYSTRLAVNKKVLYCRWSLRTVQQLTDNTSDPL